MIQPQLAVVIPAYRPDQSLADVVQKLEPWGVPVVVVNDGSGEAFHEQFERLAMFQHVEIVEHHSNRGKGAALRSGFQFLLGRYPELPGIVTADADGQHLPVDIRKVGERLAENPRALILGTRRMSASAPLRSRVGNGVSRVLYRLLHGDDLGDTQTGLRGVPRNLAEAMLASKSDRYEFELDMLIVARRRRISVEQVDVKTVYSNGNVSSHFRPWRDSMRVTFVLVRSFAASLATSVCDNVVFYTVVSLTANPLIAQVCGRVLAVALNFQLNRRVVFHFSGVSARVFARYLTLVMASGTVSYLSLTAVNEHLGVSLLRSKIIVESLLFFVNVVLMRDFVFLSSPSESAKATDWTLYYQHVPWTAHLTRRYTRHSLLQALEHVQLTRGDAPVVVELGGGNSCFASAIARWLAPRAYHVVDTNREGLERLGQQAGNSIQLHAGDARTVRLPEPADVVFSVGLIEHFNPAGTEEMIAAHFRNAKPGGWVLLSFPCPTPLYRATRAVLDFAGLWRFPDERPLDREEVLAVACRFGELQWERTLWPLLLTQHMMLFRVRG